MPTLEEQFREHYQAAGMWGWDGREVQDIAEEALDWTHFDRVEEFHWGFLDFQPQSGYLLDFDRVIATKMGNLGQVKTLSLEVQTQLSKDTLENLLEALTPTTTHKLRLVMAVHCISYDGFQPLELEFTNDERQARKDSEIHLVSQFLRRNPALASFQYQNIRQSETNRACQKLR